MGAVSVLANLFIKGKARREEREGKAGTCCLSQLSASCMHSFSQCNGWLASELPPLPLQGELGALGDVQGVEMQWEIARGETAIPLDAMGDVQGVETHTAACRGREAQPHKGVWGSRRTRGGFLDCIRFAWVACGRRGGSREGCGGRAGNAPPNPWVGVWLWRAAVHGLIPPAFQTKQGGKAELQ